MNRFWLLFFIPAIVLAEPYWQQSVHYSIQGTLSPGDHTISGKEVLEYTNNSPDTLTVVYFRLYWNLFTEGSYGDQLAKREKSYYSIPSSGVTVDSIRITDTDKSYAPEFTIDNTLMEIKLKNPLPPGGSISFSIDFKEKIPSGGYRAGHEGRDYNIAQWYPQIATYDKYGWDKSQYLGPAEFHNEFGTFDVQIMIPKSYTLGFTGSLLNPEEVYPDSVLSRLKEATRDTGTVHVADYSEMKWGAAESTMVTWKFHAENVRDFAWSANEHYIWDVVRWSPGENKPDVFVNALYFSDKAEYWKNAAGYAKFTIDYLSKYVGMYAYPNCFVVEGVVGGGMEYPGITFIGHYGDTEYHSPFGVIVHEVAHNWFPMMVGTNEIYYAFMDEGFTTFFTSVVTEAYFGRYNNSYNWTTWYQKLLCFPNSDERQGIQYSSLNLAKTGFEEPVATHTYRFNEPNLNGTSIYSKTGSVLYMLQYVLGDSVFGNVLKEYFRRWQFKHPYPEDFYSVSQEVSGQRDLRWFFDEWFNQVTTCDYALRNFDYNEIKKENQTIYRTTLSVRKNRPAIMPVDVRVTMKDSSSQTIWFPIDLWRNAEVCRDTVLDLQSPPVKAELNPDGRILDINRLNNIKPFPKFTLRFDNTLVEQTPIEAYLIRWRPSVWFTDRGGWNLGYQLKGSYLEDLYGLSLWQVYNTRDKTGNYDINASHNMFAYSPLSDISLRLYRIEGRHGGTFSLQKTFRKHYSYPPVHILKFTYSYSHLDDENYLWNPLSWEDGNLHRMMAGYAYNNRGSFWNVTASATLEASSSLFGRSDFQYSKRTFQIRTALNMPGDWKLLVRFFNGIGYGDIPNQTKYYYTGASPLDQFGTPLLRSRGVIPRTVREHTMSMGGGLMRGYYGSFIAGDKIDAINGEAQFSSLIPFVDYNLPVLNILNNYIHSSIFFDAGRIVPQSQKLWDQRFEIDCGFGLSLSSMYMLLGDFAQSNLISGIGLNTIRVDFPLYVSLPPPGENKLKFRWVLSFSQTI
jgi:hypothetical protein